MVSFQLMECASPSVETGLKAVRQTIMDCLADTAMGPIVRELGPTLGGGKMLRSRLVLAVGAATGLDRKLLLTNAATVEMLQSASLLHDDVIDGGVLRRGEPALWVKRGTKAAILMGDFLVSRTVGLVQEMNPRFVPCLVATIQEMCESEAVQELLMNDSIRDWDTCVDIARRKTGSLFAYAAAACSDDPSAGLGRALREAGYQLGTAYQLADDILDASDSPYVSDKTLGTDRLGDKLTAASFHEQFRDADPMEAIPAFINSARGQLAEWPRIQEAWDRFVEQDVQPVIDRFTLCSSTEDAA